MGNITALLCLLKLHTHSMKHWAELGEEAHTLFIFTHTRKNSCNTKWNMNKKLIGLESDNA